MLTTTALVVALLCPAQIDVLAAAPIDTPVFSAPTSIDNPLAPFEPGATQLMLGRREGTRASVVVNHLADTRAFAWSGGVVTTRVLEEQEFEDGELVEIAHTYLAQADSGTVHVFGEISWEFAAGEPQGPEQDSWIVGPPQPGDPAGLKLADQPAVFMPAEPQQGDVFNRSAIPGEPELLEVVGVSKLKVPAGKFSEVVVMKEHASDLEPGPPGFSWFAPQVGRVAEKGKGLRVKLLASSLVQDQQD